MKQRSPQSRARIEERLANWWDNGKQRSPCLLITLPPDSPAAPGSPNLPADNTSHPHGPEPGEYGLTEPGDLVGFWTDCEFRIARSLAAARQVRCFGEAIPFHWVDYVASTMEIILGCQPEFLDRESVWAHPYLTSVEEVLDAALDFSNPYYAALREMNAELAAQAPPDEPIAFFALEGISDIVAGLYGAQNYLMDLILKPNAVKRAMEHAKRLWLEAFEDFRQIIYGELTPAHAAGLHGPGSGRRKDSGCSWAGIWAPGTTFPMQEDLSYMISPEMFREFCIPHIADIASVLDYPIYHLDGIGAIPHLEEILKVDAIRAVQWIPGAGKETVSQWHELIRSVIDRGKSVQVFAEPHEIDPLVKAVGTDRLLISVTHCSEEQAEDLLIRYGE